MDLFTNDEIQKLSAVDNTWCVSIFQPAHRSGTQTQQDPIRLKNLVRRSEDQLLAAGLRKPEISALLEPIHDLIADHQFWQHQSDGLAVFAANGQCTSYRVPLPLEEQVIVARRFQLKPLFPLLTGDGHFYILALSQNRVQLYEATRHAVDAIAVEQLPDNFRDAVGLEDREKQVQYHTGSGERGGQREAIFHGHGPGGETTKELLAKYFRQIDEAVCQVLNGNEAPLVLAGVDYYFPIYREVSRCRNLLTEGVAGNPETLRPEELHAKAWPLLEPVFRKAREAALAKYRQLAGTGQTSNNLLEVLPAAFQGRVEVAFVATDRQQWGTFDPATQSVHLQESSNAFNEDLTDRAAVETFLKKGVVYALPAREIPEEAALAAIYRY